MIVSKLSESKEAPPINPPSISFIENNSLELEGLQLPP
jgi:hypothetical protein